MAKILKKKENSKKMVKIFGKWLNFENTEKTVEKNG